MKFSHLIKQYLQARRDIRRLSKREYSEINQSADYQTILKQIAMQSSSEYCRYFLNHPHFQRNCFTEILIQDYIKKVIEITKRFRELESQLEGC